MRFVTATMKASSGLSSLELMFIHDGSQSRDMRIPLDHKIKEFVAKEEAIE